MASTLKHLRSSTANKRPTASGLVDGQLAINTASGTPALFFKDSGGNVVKVGPAHVGSAAPNAVPAGSAGNSTGELWVDNSLTTAGLKYYTGSTFVNLTPSGTTTTVGLVELATPLETQTGTDGIRAVTPSGLQSKVSDSTSTTSSTTIASSTAVKSAYDLADAALPKAGGTVTGELLIGTTGSLVFEGTTDDSFETTLAVVDPTADRTITFPNVTGTVVTTGDSGTVTSTMIANDTIVNADINNAAAIAYSKLALSSGIVNTDISASAAIAGTKISPDFGSQTITTTGVISAALGAEATPSITFTGDLNTGIYSPGADQVAISTNGTGRLFVDASGNVGLGTSSPATLLHIAASSDPELRIEATGTAVSDDARLVFKTTNGEFLVQNDRSLGTSGVLTFNGASVDNLCIDHATGNVGVGTTNPGRQLQVHEPTSSASFVLLTNSTTGESNTRGIAFGLNSSEEGLINLQENKSLIFATNNTEAARLDESGRLLVGTSTSASSWNATALEVIGTTTNGGNLVIGRDDTAIITDNNIGTISFWGNDANGTYEECARISADADLTHGDGDKPTRLVFSTTADGASSPTERMRINSGGSLFIGTTDGSIPSTANKGFFRAYGNSDPSSFIAEGYQQTVGYVNREGNDGTLLQFRQANINEGSISVSGTTVSYNGAHLSRWSQIPGIDPHDKTVRPEILRGTVMSNLDEMCDWIDPESGDAQDNEQLNKTKISDVEGDKNVAGVFQSWDDDDDTWVNDYYLAMTGDFVIRIGAGVTVERGDLLMSAGDGTAKPQDDDIIRSKTIAKVTSTTVSCTHPDGSYCVPCVLMAC